MRLIISLIGFCIFSAAYATAMPAPKQISAHCWAWIGPLGPATKANQGFRMNLGFVVGSNSVAVIDSGYTPAMAKSMLQRIKKVTNKPVKYVINTNSQPHRNFGNEVFRKAGAKIIASKESAERMLTEGTQFAAGIAATLGLSVNKLSPPLPPDQLVDEHQSLSIDLGDTKLTIQHIGRTHTRGSLIVNVATDHVVFAGDVLFGGRLLALLPDGNVKEWIHGYQQLRALHAETFIPGHGQPGILSDFDHPTLGYLTLLSTAMDKAVQQSLDVNTAMDTINDQAWQKLENYQALSKRNAYQAYLESQEGVF